MQERSRSLAMVYSGMYTGSIMGLSLSPHMVQVLGWPSVFFIFGSLGVVWFALWQNKAESSPSKDERVSPQERAYIKGNTVEPVGGPARVPCSAAETRLTSCEGELLQGRRAFVLYRLA